MKAHAKLRIDRSLGGILCFFLNLACRLFGRLFHQSRRARAGPVYAICVAKFAGLGSILCSTPLLVALKARYPGARLVFVTSSRNAALVERLGPVDECLTVREDSLLTVTATTLRAVVRLLRLRPQLYFDLEVYSNYASMVATLSGARNRLGFYRLESQQKLGLFTQLAFFNTFASVHELYLQLGRIAGCRDVPAEALPLVVREEDRREAERSLEGWLGRNERLLVINPNSSDLSLERRWPVERFSVVAETLLGEIPDLKIALIGAPAERDYVGRIRVRPAERLRNLAGKLSIGGLLALLERADGVLTNDSGPMHMSFVLRRPTVALFGPVDPTHYTGLADPSRTIVLYEPLLCSPCLHHVDQPPCGGDNQCMKLLRTESVTAACRALLKGTRNGVLQSWKGGSARAARDGAGTPLGRVSRIHA